MSDETNYASEPSRIAAAKQIGAPFGNRTIDEEAACSLATEAVRECGAKLFDILPKSRHRDRVIELLDEAATHAVAGIPATAKPDQERSENEAQMVLKIDQLQEEISELEDQLSASSGDAERAGKTQSLAVEAREKAEKALAEAQNALAERDAELESERKKAEETGKALEEATAAKQKATDDVDAAHQKIKELEEKIENLTAPEPDGEDDAQNKQKGQKKS
jgi:chromosome segregation ATPase